MWVDIWMPWSPFFLTILRSFTRRGRYVHPSVHRRFPALDHHYLGWGRERYTLLQTPAQHPQVLRQLHPLYIQPITNTRLSLIHVTALFRYHSLLEWKHKRQQSSTPSFDTVRAVVPCCVCGYLLNCLLISGMAEVKTDCTVAGGRSCSLTDCTNRCR